MNRLSRTLTFDSIPDGLAWAIESQKIAASRRWTSLVSNHHYIYAAPGPICHISAGEPRSESAVGRKETNGGVEVPDITTRTKFYTAIREQNIEQRRSRPYLNGKNVRQVPSQTLMMIKQYFNRSPSYIADPHTEAALTVTWRLSTTPITKNV